MKQAQATYILEQLKIFDGLARKATDEAGWIALKMGVSRAKAQRMIDEAKAKAGGNP